MIWTRAHVRYKQQTDDRIIDDPTLAPWHGVLRVRIGLDGPEMMMDAETIARGILHFEERITRPEHVGVRVMDVTIVDRTTLHLAGFDDRRKAWIFTRTGDLT